MQVNACAHMCMLSVTASRQHHHTLLQLPFGLLRESYSPLLFASWRCILLLSHQVRPRDGGVPGDDHRGHHPRHHCLQHPAARCCSDAAARQGAGEEWDPLSGHMGSAAAVPQLPCSSEESVQMLQTAHAQTRTSPLDTPRSSRSSSAPARHGAERMERVRIAVTLCTEPLASGSFPWLHE